MNIKSLLAGAALTALSTSAFAGTVTVGDLTVPQPGQASSSGSAPSVKGSFTEYFVVNVIGAFNSLTAAVTASSSFAGTWDLYFGAVPTGTLIGSSTVFTHNGSTFGAVQDTTGGVGGEYYAEVVGTSSNPVALAVSFTGVSAIPELSTWGMMLAGFGALAFAGYRRRVAA
jgi:hypothetical protein